MNDVNNNNTMQNQQTPVQDPNAQQYASGQQGQNGQQLNGWDPNQAMQNPPQQSLLENPNQPGPASFGQAGESVKYGKPAGANTQTTAGSQEASGMAVSKRDVENVVSSWTGIPISKLTEDESAKLLKLEDRIHQRLIDQEEAVVKVSEAVRRGRIGLASGQRPIASFIFLGPSGTGKTELAKTLAELLFGKDDMMVRLDMSEYMEKHEVAKLIGAPPGYVGYEEGGQLTEAVRAKPYSIVLLDEVEKAHPDVFNVLLQLLEDGRLTDNKGNTISFKNTIVICTSNIGSALITEKLSQQDTKAKKTAQQYAKDFAELSELVSVELRKFFRPELLNRFDDIVIFKPLRREDMVGIAKRGIEKTAKLLKEQGYSIQITDRALLKLAKEGYDPMYGARPLRRLVQGSIENPVALEIIGKKFTLGDTIRIDFDEQKNQFLFLNASRGSQPQSASQVSSAAAQTVPGQQNLTEQQVNDGQVQGQWQQQQSSGVQQPAQQDTLQPVVAATEFDPLSVLPPEQPMNTMPQIPGGGAMPPQGAAMGAAAAMPANPMQQPYGGAGQVVTGQPMQATGYGAAPVGATNQIPAAGAAAAPAAYTQQQYTQFTGQPQTYVNEVPQFTYNSEFNDELKKE